jgi:hypothetical protein
MMKIEFSAKANYFFPKGMCVWEIFVCMVIEELVQHSLCSKTIVPTKKEMP